MRRRSCYPPLWFLVFFSGLLAPVNVAVLFCHSRNQLEAEPPRSLCFFARRVRVESEAVRAKEAASLTLLQELEQEEAKRKAVEEKARSKRAARSQAAAAAKEAAAATGGGRDAGGAGAAGKSKAGKGRAEAVRKFAEEEDRERAAEEERRQLDAARWGLWADNAPPACLSHCAGKRRCRFLSASCRIVLPLLLGSERHTALCRVHCGRRFA